MCLTYQSMASTYFRYTSGIVRGVTGAVVDTMEEAVRMLPQVLALDRHAVRRRFEQRFSSVRMAKDYVAVYRSLLDSAGAHPERGSAEKI